MFWIKVYRVQGHVVLAACDEGLLGREFREGKAVLRVSETYYGGEKVSGERLRELLEEADIVGVVGDNALRIVVELGYARPGDEKRIQGVPHLNIYKL